MLDAIDRLLAPFARGLHMLAAVWLFLLAFLILADVLGRGLFAAPIQGTPELVANSIVSIAFLQLTHSVRMRGMLRADFLDAFVSPRARTVLHVVGYVVGVAFFLAIAYASWGPMLRAWEISEYQGEGALRVPTTPVRIIIVVTSVLAALAYLGLAVKALRGEE
jgi:TRAP-type C4-dicarboxylate transport system permease small subunit